MPHPWENAFLDLHRQVDEMFEELVYRPWSITGRASWRPSLDIHETVDAYLVVIDLPDVAPEDAHIAVEERRLIVRGRRHTAAPAGVLFQRCERPAGDFERSVAFAAPVNPKEARVQWGLGVCRIHLPKQQQS